MKSDNAKLLLGLGLGVLVGAAAGILLAADKEKLKEGFDAVKDGARDAYEQAKSTAEEIIAKGNEVKESIKGKAEEILNRNEDELS